MNQKWDQEAIQEYIDNKIQESLTLDYKAAAALGKSDGKKKEITKDVSAMANSDGGIIIYGIKEYQSPSKKHLPESIDPIDQTHFTKEWLEQVINNIRPHINGLKIYPVSLNSSQNHTAYVVVIPQSTTAHQALDWRYYKRFNFQSIPMADYEIRDVMNRATTPDAQIEFGLYHWSEQPESYVDYYRLRVMIRNQGTQVIDPFKVILVLTNVDWWYDDRTDEVRIRYLSELKEIDNSNTEYAFEIDKDNHHVFKIICQSSEGIFPKEEIDIGKEIKWAYSTFHEGENLSWSGTWQEHAKQMGWSIKWKLYADNMTPKEGIISVHEL
jgi:hypothetical protein